MNDTTPPSADELVAALVQVLSDGLREEYEERAAIMQFDGELPQGHAEALALLDVLARHPGALMAVDAYQITRDGNTRFLLCATGRITQRRLQDLGYEVKTWDDIAWLLREQFDGIAYIEPAGKSQG